MEPSARLLQPFMFGLLRLQHSFKRCRERERATFIVLAKCRDPAALRER